MNNMKEQLQMDLEKLENELGTWEASTKGTYTLELIVAKLKLIDLKIKLSML